MLADATLHDCKHSFMNHGICPSMQYVVNTRTAFYCFISKIRLSPASEPDKIHRTMAREDRRTKQLPDTSYTRSSVASLIPDLDVLLHLFPSFQPDLRQAQLHLGGIPGGDCRFCSTRNAYRCLICESIDFRGSPVPA